MYFSYFNYVRILLLFLILVELFPNYTCGISINKSLLFINYRNIEPYPRVIRPKIYLNNEESNLNKYVDNFLKSPENKSLFKSQVSNYSENESELTNLSKSQSWSEIVYDEILKNKALESQEDPDHAESLLLDPKTKYTATLKKEPYNYKLTPEGRLKLEDRIEHLKRTAHSNPIKYKEQRPNLWIVRSSLGNYCKLMDKDDDRIKSLVTRVRKYFTPSELQILVMKLNIRMPLCEVMFEGTMTDLVRIFYARGGTLQFYVTPRFWTRCDLIEKDPRLEAMYGKATSPGLFPQWDEDGMMEEIMDCMDTRPDYALEFRSPNAWHVIPMMPEYDKRIMKAYFDGVHWPTRLKVQRAFEEGIEDYRTVIEKEYEELQKKIRIDDGLLDEWLTTPDKFN